MAGLPVILLIHFLQRRSRRVWITTGFLLATEKDQAMAGKRFERLTSTPPLWMQLAAVLLLAALLAQPRLVGEQPLQRVVMVLDGSASMQAFRSETLAALEETSAELETLATRTEWVLLDTRPGVPPLYSGGRRSEMLEAARREWDPLGGEADFHRLLRSWPASEGPVVVLSDREQNVPDGVRVRGVGHPVTNVGFTAGNVDPETGRWQALVRNAGPDSAVRQWWLEVDEERRGGESFELAPGATITLEGTLTGDRLEVVLEPDDFSLDDRLPLVRPREPDLRVAQGSATRLAARLWQAMPGLVPVPPGQEADLRWVDYDPLRPGLPEGPALVFGGGPVHDTLPDSGTAALHPLVENLDFSGLRTAGSLQVPALEADETVVWIGSRRGVILRPSERGDMLIFNFPPDASTAERLPATAILVHRYLEGVRQSLPGERRRNLLTGQSILVPLPDPLTPAELRWAGGTAEVRAGLPVRAPGRPGFFELLQDGELLMEGAAQFGELEQGEFADADSFDPTMEYVAARRQLGSRGEEWNPIGILLLMGLLAACWSWPWKSST